VFGRAKAKARATACLSNIRQLALAVKMYQGDWNDYYPPIWGAEWEKNVPDEGISWTREWFYTAYGTQDTHYTAYDPLNPPPGSVKLPNLLIIPTDGTASMYIQNVDVCVCPDWTWPGVSGGLKHKLQSYGANGVFGFGKYYCGVWPSRWSDGSMSDLARWVMLADLESPWWDYSSLNARMHYWTIAFPANRHNGMSNCAYADGHAGARRRSSFWGTIAAEQTALTPPGTDCPDTRYPIEDPPPEWYEYNL